MTNGQNSIGLIRVAYYKAPKDKVIVPCTIPQNEERVEIITGGYVWFESGNNRRCYGRGTIFRHREGQHTVCMAVPENPYRCLALQFSGVKKETAFPRVSYWTTRSTLSLFKQELLSAFHSPLTDRTALSAYALATVNWHSSQSLKIPNNDEMPPGIQECLAYLKKHPENNVPVEKLAELANYSKAHFHALFKKFLGMTPHRYQLDLRISSACRELASSTMPVGEISRMFGFESTEDFSRAFRRLRGMSPGKYRKEHSVPL